MFTHSEIDVVYTHYAFGKIVSIDTIEDLRMNRFIVFKRVARSVLEPQKGDTIAMSLKKLKYIERTHSSVKFTFDEDRHRHIKEIHADFSDDEIAENVLQGTIKAIGNSTENIIDFDQVKLASVKREPVRERAHDIWVRNFDSQN